MIYCLDTNVIISVMRKKSRVLAKLHGRDVTELRIPEVVRAELYLGCLKSNDPIGERNKVNHVIDPIDLVPFGGDAVEHYASIRHELEEKGSIIGPNDLMIAAIARSIGAVMVTSNTCEFSRVPGLVVEDWLN